MAKSINTLDYFLKSKGLMPKDWYYASAAPQVIQTFVDCDKSYTLLPEYLAKFEALHGGRVKDTMRYCNTIAKVYNLDGAKLTRLVLDKTIAFVASDLKINI